MKKALHILTFIVFVLAVSCTQKVGTPPAKTEPLPAGACDSIKYSNGIKFILDKNCATGGCHDNVTVQSGFDFSLYTVAKTKALDGRIKARMIDAVHPLAMPPSGNLPQPQLDSILCWIEKGAPQ